jgi:hypothetical protein
MIEPPRLGKLCVLDWISYLKRVSVHCGKEALEESTKISIFRYPAEMYSIQKAYKFITTHDPKYAEPDTKIVSIV